MKTMTHRGYTAEIHYSEEDGCFVGHVINIEDIVGFHGDTDDELRDAFEGMVDFYIEVCKTPENPPQKQSGGLLSRLLAALQQTFRRQFPWRTK